MKTKEEIEILRADAVAGDAVAQNDLGCAYSSGDGVVKNLKEAFIWFERSAKQGNKFGQYNVGRYYQYGFGTPQNIQLAIEWYEKSAAQNYGKAANILGEIYEKGYIPNISDRSLNQDSSTIIQANSNEAFYWYSQGEYSEDTARFNLARCYELGIGTPKSLSYACSLYKICKEDKAKKRLDSIKQSYNPILDISLQQVEVLGNNPYRIIGVWSNSSEREIRANLSKMKVMSKIGKDIMFETDHLLPCNISDIISINRNKVDYYENQVLTSSELYKETNRHYAEKYKSVLNDCYVAEQVSPSWEILPNRKIDNVNIAIQKLASDIERIKYALFWFCNYTPEDKIGFDLLSKHKWLEANNIWLSGSGFSAYLNRAIMQWSERNYPGAIVSLQKLIHNKTCREEFLSVVTSGRVVLSEDELSNIFWDAIYDFPETEINLHNKLSYGLGNGGSRIWGTLLSEGAKEYNLNKGFNILKAPIDDMLRIAENQDENDFENSKTAYEKIANETPYILLRIKRLVGEENYRYKLLCNEVADILLNYAIHYNNDKKDDWTAPQTAFFIASSAMNIAIDENLRERCKQNIEIFKHNKQVSSTDQLLDAIGKIFKEVDEKSVTLEQVEKIQKDVELFLSALKTENGKDSDLYQKVSDNAVNAILNIIITICNKNKDATTAISASGILKNLKSMNMSSETRSRLERNNSIISNNMVAAMRRGNLGDLGGPKKTYSKEENKSRRIHKTWATICSVVAFALMWYYMSWNNNLQYFMETMPLWGYICIIFMVFIALFPVIMWGLEFQKDPHNTRLYWIDNSVESLYVLSNDIMRAGVQGRKTYSWPFAIPFQLLGIAIWILSFPIKGMAKLAAMIK